MAKKDLTSRVLTCLGIVLLAVLALPILLIAQWRLFGGDYEIELPNGYRLVRVYGSTICLDKGIDQLLAPTVDGYRVHGDIVVGHVSWDEHYSRNVSPSVPGFFLVDTKKGTLFQGLSEEEWLKVLKKHGITGSPQLRRPSRWDRYRKW
jgi:hypothetical protein